MIVPIMRREVVCGEGGEKNSAIIDVAFLRLGSMRVFSLSIYRWEFKKAIAIVHYGHRKN